MGQCMDDEVILASGAYYQKEEDKTDKSVVYLIRCGKSNFYKIGTARNIKARLRGLQVANPYRLHLIATRLGKFNLEFQLHRKFAKYQYRLEWFRFSKKELKKVLLYFNYVDK